MSRKELLIKEIEQVPEKFFDDLMNFIQFLQMKELREKSDTAVTSESALSKDWMKPEEDEAWANL